MIQWIRWLRAHLAMGQVYTGTERRCGRERRQCLERRCEPRSGEFVYSRRLQQRRDTQPAGR